MPNTISKYINRDRIDKISKNPIFRIIRIIVIVVIILLVIYAIIDIVVSFSDEYESPKQTIVTPNENEETEENSEEEIDEETEEKVDEEFLSVMREIIDRISSKEAPFQETSKSYVWWVNNSGSNLSFPSNFATEMLTLNAYNQLKDDQSLVRETLVKIRTVFTDNKFVKNVNTSSKSFDDESFYDYMESFEKDNYRCNVVVDPDLYSYEQKDVNSSLYITCSSAELKKVEDEQLYLLRALGDAGEQNQGVIAEIVSQGENITIASIFGRRTGHIVYFYKMDNAYKVIYSGQDRPPCSLFKDYPVSDNFDVDCDGFLLQGIWQQNQVMAAGWSEKYHFFPSGNFHYYPNSMSAEEEKIEKVGKWVLNGDILTTTTYKQIIRNYDCPTNNQMDCTFISEKEVTLSTPKVETFTIVDFGIVDGDYRPSISIGKDLYWKFGGDASRYGDEIFDE